MKTTFNFRSVVFQRAYRIVKSTGCTMSAALTEAWKRYRNYRDEVVRSLVDRIKGFDRYYYMSDDNSTYMYWSRQQDDIRKQIRTLPGSFISGIASQLSDQECVQNKIPNLGRYSIIEFRYLLVRIYLLIFNIFRINFLTCLIIFQI